MRRIAVLALALAAVVGCGVPVQNTAQPIPADAIPAPLPLPTPSPSPTPEETVEPSPQPTTEIARLWFVREDGLVAVEVPLAIPVTAQAVVADLAAGPSVEEIIDGIRTVARDPITGQSLVAVVGDPAADVTGRVIATVALAPAFAALPPTEQVLLLGQVVLSLTSQDIDGVTFVDDNGSPVAVPLPDGRLLDVPAIARDYASLIVEL